MQVWNYNYLTQSQAKWLGEKLIKFAKTGELSDG